MADINALIPIDVTEKINGELKTLLDSATTVTITNAVELENMDHLCVALKRWETDLEKDRKRFKDPHWNNGLSVDGFFKPFQERTKARIKVFNEAMFDFREKVRAAEAAEKKRLDDIATAEQKRLDDIADAKLREEQQLIDDANAKLKMAQETTDTVERDKLTMQANTSLEVADIAASEANEAAKAASEVSAPPVLSSLNFRGAMKSKEVYTVSFENEQDRIAFIRYCVSQNKFHWLTVNEGLVNNEIKANDGKWAAPGATLVKERKFTNTKRSAV